MFSHLILNALILGINIFCKLFQKILILVIGNIVLKIVTDSHYWLCESSIVGQFHCMMLPCTKLYTGPLMLETLSRLAESSYDDTLSE